MSASKIGKTDPFKPFTLRSKSTQLHLSSNAVRIRKNGIEFRSESPLQMYTEMTVTLETPYDTKTFTANGVVVGCHGTRHAGYLISVVFTDLSLPAKARLQLLAFSSLS